MRGGGWGALLYRSAGTDALDARAVSVMRCLLVLSTLLIVVFDPVGERFSPPLYAALVGYAAYSVALCIVLLGGGSPVPERAHYWLDLAAFAAIVALAERSHTGGVFHHLFLFVILVAAFTRGLGEGLLVTFCAAALLITACMAAGPAATEFDELVARPVLLMVLGYMISVWGGHELALRRRLRLLKEIASPANARLGIDHAVAQTLERVRDHFSSADCLLVCRRGEGAEYVMYRAQAQPRALTAQAAGALLALPGTRSIVWSRAARIEEPELRRACERLANLTESSSFVSVPYRQLQSLRGRLFVTGERRFGAGEAEFLEQVVEQLAATIDNLALMDTVMGKAAQLERARISRDIHDTTVQPYIGLKLALEALCRRLPQDSPVRGQVEELVQMSDAVVEDLRGYVARLRGHEGDDARWPGEHLLAGLREHLERYRSFYGIDMQLRSEAPVQLSDRVAAEAYQIVCEALSNIHRHTVAKQGYVSIRCNRERLAIEVANECRPHAAAAAFTPRSIAERAAALGGTTEVLLAERGYDVVRVAIPL